MPLNDTGAYEKALRALDDIEATVRAALPIVADAMIASVKTRTPSKDEEYAALMLGDDNPEGADFVERDGDRSGDSDTRIRLQKDAGTWLVDVNASPANIQIDEGTKQVSIGNRFVLLNASYYKYKNKKYGWHTAGPYFEAFEYGALGYRAIVTPNKPARKGGKYPLRPSVDPDYPKSDSKPAYFYMRKPINGRAMYADFNLRAIVQEALAKCLSELAPGHPNLK